MSDVQRPIRTFIESTPAAQLLEFMQRERQHIAVLVDEHGATAGMVTFEDLVEELVGEVMSEHEKGNAALEREVSGTLVTRGDVALREIARELELELKRRPASRRSAVSAPRSPAASFRRKVPGSPIRAG